MLRVNEARWDRVLRVILGVSMLLLGWSGAVGVPLGIALELFGWIPFITGLVGWDPLYALLGYSTKSSRRRPS